MGKYAQIVLGPAGVGKSTYCAKIAEHCETIKRRVHIINLDPAAEDPLRYEPTIDVRELVKTDEVAEELSYGPNGALLYSMQYLLDNIDWLLDKLGDFDDDYLIFDMPGQLELYSHVPVIRTLVDTLKTQSGYSIVGLYLIDSHFLADPTVFISGALACLSAMVRLEIPHINVLSKMDLVRTALPLAKPHNLYTHSTNLGSISCGMFGENETDLLQRVHESNDDDEYEYEDKDKEEEEEEEERDDGGIENPDADVEGSIIEKYINVDVPFIMGELEKHTGPAFTRLNRAICELLEDYSMVSFAPLDISSKGSLETLLRECDNAIQFGEDEEPRDPDQNKDQDQDQDLQDEEDQLITDPNAPSLEEND